MSTLINWFEIPVTDMARAVAFYQRVLNAEFRRETIAGVENAIFSYNQPATGGSLVKGERFVPSETGAVIYLYTPDIVQALQQVEAVGGRLDFGPQVLPYDIGTIALMIDSEGNRVGLHQPV
ncbi:VOC family protein [Enterobacter sp. Cy-643]|uniref:VOC family protein n=1 Tax=Enterobacter sp. Cy-643 TaxID=2608346 RepID=UPI00141FE9F4|nr:VOC family protein [Enterobacter sp. Cy-643]NIF32922.1 VOC family protein [Enterobacter sp. Cy-643]